MSIESKIKHLEMIQGVIARMANNSFLLKGWTVTLVSAVLAIASSSINSLVIYGSVLVTISFWVLDAYYLMLERQYRALYDAVRRMDNNIVDFSMRISYDIRTLNHNRLVKCLFSISQLLYLVLFIVEVVIIVYVYGCL